jgi:hypothetical protein
VRRSARVCLCSFNSAVGVGDGQGWHASVGRASWLRALLLAAGHCGCCSSFFVGGSVGYFSFICVLFVHCDLCPSLDASKKIQSLSAAGLLVDSIQGR